MDISTASETIETSVLCSEAFSLGLGWLLPCSFGLIHPLSDEHPHPKTQGLAWSSRLMETLPSSPVAFRSFTSSAWAHGPRSDILISLEDDAARGQVEALYTMCIFLLRGCALTGASAERP